MCACFERSKMEHWRSISRSSWVRVCPPRGADDLARIILFIEGLSSTEIMKEGRREHHKTSEDAIRTARTARVRLNDSRQDADGGIATMRS